MITICVLGLDQFVVGHYSKDHTANLANLFECEKELINFYAPNSMVFHEGVEQTSWNTIVIVKAPSKYRPFANNVRTYLIKTLSDFSINIEIIFEYFEMANYSEHVNSTYPRYIQSENIREVNFSTEEEEEECDCEEHDHHHHEELDIDDPNQIYLGNAFADVDLDKKGK